MMRDPRYDILFEPVKIGPVTAKNRFYQVPHCSGMGYTRPRTLHRARELNAEGGWAVVCTEYCSIHPSANDDPYPQCTLWDENDVKTLADMTERVHRHGALAGVELWYGGYSTGNHLVTTKPVVGVGRFTSPDTMAGQIRRGVLDMIGAARPAIADPFLPRKIEEGRIDDIRECIGCNICIWSNGHAVPMRCTQNPTRGEEWRRGWHPEKIHNAHADESVLVVGGGPAGLEAARALGLRGYRVTLAEAGTELGGRVTRESGLPGLSEWARVRDYRISQIRNLPNVEVYLDSRLDAAQVLEFGFQHTCIATGAKWRADGRGRFRFDPIEGCPHERVIAPDAVMDGARVEGPIAVYDDDHFYMGGLIAEKLRLEGLDVLLVTSASCLSPEAARTLEQDRIQTRALELGVDLLVSHRVTSFDGDNITVDCAYSGKESTRACRTLVPVTSREPNDDLYLELSSNEGRLRDAGILSLSRIGDCTAPGLIAQAVFAGHRFARELGANDIEVDRDRVVIESAR